MRILHVHKFFNLHRGAEIYMQDLMRVQERRGDAVRVLSTKHPANLPSAPGSRFVTRYDYSRSEGALMDAKKAVNFMWNREAARAMDDLLEEFRPDVVHLHNIYHHLSASILRSIRRAGVPCVQTLHDLKLACPNYRMYTEGAPCDRCKGGRYYQAVRHHCISSSFLPNMLAALEMGFTKTSQAYERTVRTFICPSDFMARKMVEWGEPASKFTVIRMPLPRRPKPAKRGGGYALAVGSLSPEKGYEQLIEACAHVPGLALKIAGIGPEEDRLRSLIRSRDIANVELVGFKRGEELDSLYDAAEMFIASPIGYENAPLSVMDALAWGLPLIATDIGGLPEMVREGRNGFLVERGNVQAWITTLRQVTKMAEATRREFAEESLRMAQETYPDWDLHADAVETAYRQAMAAG